ncbi:MAG: hypothetical protein JOZ73_04360 [Solirubrobacterales bacterium]|nr:hypothetical protein [Solirubrobacterales bacterium]
MEQATAPKPPASAPDGQRAETRQLDLVAIVRRYPAIATALALLAVSTAIVAWAKTRPSFDAYGWLVWGHQTIVGNLNTNAAPSWKPLTYIFTAPFALAGHYQVWLWMIASTAISLSASIFAGRIAYRLVDAPPERAYARWAAAIFAALAVLGIRDITHYILSFQSDPVIVALCLGAIDCHLSRRPRWAFALGVLASLGRPEVWPFLAIYAIWAWRAIPEMRRLILVGVAVEAVLWFGIPAITSRTPFVAGTNAIGSGRALHNNRVFGTVDRFLDLHETPLEIFALLSVGWALYRRDRRVLALALGAVLWVIVEIAFALHGWPGLPRYMYEAGAVMVVIAAVGIGWLIAEPPGRALSIAGALAAILIAASLIPAAVSRADIERKDLRVQRERTKQINRLAGVVSRLGGAGRFKPCGEPLTRLEYQTVVAWTLRVNVATVGFRYSRAIRRGNPIVLFTPERRGWKVQALHQRLHSCRALPR